MGPIELIAPADVDDFCAFLRAVHVQVDGVDHRLVHATIPGSPSEMHERRELSGYVATWNALNPGRGATLLEG